jgi:hypothetical protein
VARANGMFIYESIFNFLGCASKKIASYSLDISMRFGAKRNHC